MHHPFVLRVACQEEATAFAIRDALRRGLHARGTRAPVRILTALRGGPGAHVAVGLRPVEGPAWLPPLPVAAEPEAAAAEVFSFLERWGFVAAPRAS